MEEIDVSQLNCDHLISWLSTQEIALNKIKETFKSLLLIFMYVYIIQSSINAYGGIDKIQMLFYHWQLTL